MTSYILPAHSREEILRELSDAIAAHTIISATIGLEGCYSRVSHLDRSGDIIHIAFDPDCGD